MAEHRSSNQQQEDKPDLPLAGITVLDLSQVYNGPYATFLMAQAGATVIKIEPPGGESLRGRRGHKGAGVPFAMLNANKRSVGLNFKTIRGREIFIDLAKTADVVVENYAPGVVARLGVGYDDVRKINPGIIYASSSGYGQTGPYREYPAMDLTMQAMSGTMSVTGFPDSPPVKAGPAFTDFLGGVHLYGAITTALFRRERTGKGTYIDIAMIEAVYPALASSIGGFYSGRENVPIRTGNRHSGLALAPYNVYPAADGHIAILCNNDKNWAGLTHAMEREDLTTAPGFATIAERVKNMEEVDRLIGGWSSLRPLAELFDLLIANRVPCAPIREVDEIITDPHMHERGMLFEIDHPTLGPLVVCRSPINYSGTARVEYRPSPTYGQDTDDFLRERFGLSDNEIAKLRDEKVI